MPFNIVWNFSLAFFHRSFTCILGGCFWIFHYLMNSYEFRKWKAISHVHAQAKRRHTYKISSKNKVILIIITNRFFFIYFSFCFQSVLFLLSSYCTFDFVVFYLLYLLWSSFFICWLPFLLLFDSGFSFVWLCYFTSIWITGHKRININYTTKLNHRRRRFRAPAMIHQNWKLTAGQGIH